MNKVVKIRNLTKQFGTLTAVDSIDLDIKTGEIYGLLGPNGAGKSTIINMMSGLLPKDQGNIQIMGKEISKAPDFVKKNIGVVPQDIAIYEDLTAYENVRFFAGLYGLRGLELKQNVERALSFVGLEDKINDYPKQFSGGMKRRLNIACAIAHVPNIIIMDEPTVGIDPQSRNHILQSVRKLSRKGCTIIYTTHYMEEVEAVCTRIGIIDHGKVIAEGTKEELKSLIAEQKTIELTLASSVPIKTEEITEIPGIVDIHINGFKVKVTTDKKVNSMNELILYFTSKKVDIQNVETMIPDLETVFLTLTGRTLRN